MELHPTAGPPNGESHYFTKTHTWTWVLWELWAFLWGSIAGLFLPGPPVLPSGWGFCFSSFYQGTTWLKLHVTYSFLGFPSVSLHFSDVPSPPLWFWILSSLQQSMFCYLNSSSLLPQPPIICWHPPSCLKVLTLLWMLLWSDSWDDGNLNSASSACFEWPTSNVHLHPFL